jgi:hypothetical protein
MPLDFPSNPTANQSYSYGSKTWIYNGYGWKQKQITSNVEISSILLTGDGATSTFDLGFSPVSNTALIVTIGGIVQSELDYNINGVNNTISFVEPPPVSENVRVVGYKTITPYYLDVANSIGAVVETFNGVGDGATQTYNLGFNPYGANSVFVSVGGIIQPDNAYTVSNVSNTITFGTAPQNNENIRVVGYSRVNPFITYYVNSNVSVSVYESTANGNTSTFALGFNPQAREVLTVTIDGIVQPISVYTVNTTANTITFDSAPANNELVRVSTFYTAANAFVIPDGTVSLIKVDSQVYNLIFNSSNVANSTANTINSSVQIVQDAANLAIANVVSASSNVLSNTSVLNTANAALLIANAASLTANAASLTANNASNTANSAATTGKAIAMSIVFGG